MAAIKGKELSDLVIQSLQKMRNEDDFKNFYDTINKYKASIEPVDPPTLPRKRKRPKNYSILQYVFGYEGSAKNDYYPETPFDHYKLIYLEAVDTIISAIKGRFEQPAFKRFMNVEQLIFKAAKKLDVTEELKILESDLSGDFDAHQLKSELDLLPVIFKELPTNFDDVCKTLQAMDKEKRTLIDNIWTIVRIVLTSGATSATPERSFSLQRRIKTWIRSTMNQKRYNSLSVLHEHKIFLIEFHSLK